ncbi:MAG: hypothetical protein IJ688_10930 [Treponema sp.]|nr:hypothetical protein [Treponema sp.]
MKREIKRFFTEERILDLGGFLILSVAAVISLMVEAETRTILPAPEITIPVINSLCALAALVQFFFPNKHIISYSVMLIQSVSTILTGYETLGVFLFTALIILMFCNKDLRNHFYAKFIPLLAVLLLSLFGVLPFGLFRFILAFAESVFFLSFYFCIYKKLENLLSSIAPAFRSAEKLNISLPEAGQTILLSDLGLNERQQNFIFDILNSNSSYNDLSQKYYVSTSTVKKEMADAFRLVGVKNLEELRILLLQYRVRR